MADATNRCGIIGCYVEGPHSHGTTTGGTQVENKLRWRIAGLEAKVKRLRTRDLAMKEQYGGYLDRAEKAEAGINAALRLYETAMEIPPLAEQMYKALKGEA